MDKFLRGEENKFKEHKNFVNYKYEYMDKSYPNSEKAHNLIFSPLKESKQWEGLAAEIKRLTFGLLIVI